MQQAKKPLPPQNPGMKQASFSTYWLDWKKLKAFLETRFPQCQFGDERVVSPLVTNDYLVYRQHIGRLLILILSLMSGPMLR